MPEYIERDVLLKRFERYSSGFIVEDDYDTALTIIHGAPIDDELVEVVRCKDCKYFGKDLGYGKHDCKKHEMPYCLENDYCGYGEE